MAGPPRSKGCLACVKRHVRCDEARPECETCQRRGKQCPGYERERRFVVYDFPPSNGYFPAKNTPRPSKGRSTHSRLSSSSSSSCESTEITSDLQRQPVKRVRPLDISVDVSVASSLAAGVWRLQYRQSIFAMMEGNLAPVHNAYSQRLDWNWAVVLQNPHGNGHSAEEWAFRCLGVYQIGQMNGDRKQILASREIYGRAIRELSRALSIPSLALSDGTLSAAIILGVYEILNEDGHSYWGPEHISMVFGALIKAERCFLEDEEWAEMGRETMRREKKLGKESPVANLSESAFQDIARCPGCLAQTKKIVSSTTRQPQKERRKLAERIRASSRTLEAIKRDLIAGLNTSQLSTGGQFEKFMGAMPMESAISMAEYSIEGIASAIKFLQKLLVALEHGQSQSPSIRTDKGNTGSIANNDNPMASKPTVEEISLPCLSGWGRDPKEVVFVRVALSMGMMVGPPEF
ncbi:C6 finger domain protein [Penicillium hetheringtonii]|uniref:C6 finger domain protein n=1 Tax=Penicillium hetheringtonii TaxID=911720 RepID=A0AAD6GP28_9EURO|nr:C6 finger domain protein [Penicillium hetheringtonii]